MAKLLHEFGEESSGVPTLRNITHDQLTDEELFLVCWNMQSCDECLSSKQPCSWCDISQVCVPNKRAPFPFQIFAPIKYEDICPLNWRERWELRAKPFSCRCSTMTLLSVMVAVLATLAGVLLIWLFVKCSRAGARRWRERDREWWQRRITVIQVDPNGEHRPLLREG